MKPKPFSTRPSAWVSLQMRATLWCYGVQSRLAEIFLALFMFSQLLTEPVLLFLHRIKGLPPMLEGTLSSISLRLLEPKRVLSVPLPEQKKRDAGSLVISVSPLWLTSVLRAKNILKKGEEVKDVKVQSLSENRGLASAIFRLHLTYSTLLPSSGSSLSLISPPSTIILKMTKAVAMEERKRSIASGQYREAIFLRHASDLWNKRDQARESELEDERFLTPTIYFSSASAFTGSFLLLMEDLEKRDSLGLNFYFGNQIWGLPPLPARHNRDEKDVLREVVLATAAFHALHWRDSSLFTPRSASFFDHLGLSASFFPNMLKAASWYRGEREALWWLSIEFGRASWETTKHKFGLRCPPSHPSESDSSTSSASSPDKKGRGTAAEAHGGVRWSPKLVSIIEESYRRASWEALQAHLHDPAVPFTLTHGDFHAANMMYILPFRLLSSSPGTLSSLDSSISTTASVQDGGRVMLLDWSEVGVWEPMTDIGQMMISDIKVDVRRKHEKELIRLYWERLTSSIRESPSDPSYTWEQCWADYGRGGVERWLWVFSVLAAMPLHPAAVQYFHDQLLSFIEDHGDCSFYQLKPVIPLLPDGWK